MIVVSAAILIGLERVYPYEPRQKLFREGLLTDLFGYGIAQSYLLGLLITAIIVWVNGHTGLSRLQLVSAWPVAAQLGFFFVTHDLYIYWFHRLQHHSDLLWRIHEAHHSVDDVDWLSGSRSHAFEILINQTIEFLPIVLLGAAPEVALMKATLDAVWGMYIHSNLDVRHGRLGLIFNGPEMHRWHHARDLAPPARTSAPSSRSGTSFSERPTARRTSPSTTAYPIRRIRSAEPLPTWRSTCIRSALQSRRRLPPLRSVRNRRLDPRHQALLVQPVVTQHLGIRAAGGMALDTEQVHAR